MRYEQARQINLELSTDSSIDNFYDFNNETTIHFKRFYKNQTIDPEFLEKIFTLFEQFDSQDIVSLSDSFFNNLTVVFDYYTKTGQYTRAAGKWDILIRDIKRWEGKSGKSIHKGTAYYFAAVNCLMAWDIDAGCINMSLALEEDKKNQPENKTPAHHFFTLNEEEPTQYFREFVIWANTFLRERLDGKRNKDNYSLTRNGKLSYLELRKKFLDSNNLEKSIRFYFTFSIIKIWRLRILQKKSIGDSIVAPLIFSNAISNILLSIESLLRDKYPEAEKTLAPLLENFIHELQISPIHPGEINKSREKNFSGWLLTTLEKSNLNGDLSLVYGLRNYSFHGLISQKILWDHFTKVMQSVMNVFFFIIERKY